LFGLGFLCSGGKEFSVVGLKVTLLVGTSLLSGSHGSFTLETLRSHQSLDLRGLGVCLLSFFSGDLSLDNVFSHIISTVEVEERSQFTGTLWAKTTWSFLVGDIWDFFFSLLDNDEGKDGDIGIDNASSDGLSFTFTSSSWSVAAKTFFEEEFDTFVGKDTLFHWETLFVVTTRDSENISLEVFSEGISWNFVGDTFIVKWLYQLLIFDVNGLLGTSLWV